ncbi:RDD family protein [Flavobacterium sp.]|uniref:RDD family protein n=1 Tax=Flavobacterium sp. TaxID=239 RepID=UPI0039E6CE96
MKIEHLGRRILAYLIDSFVVQFACVLITDAFELNKRLGSFLVLNREFVISFSCYFIILFVYLALTDAAFGGRTLGKRIFKLKTIGQNGQPLSVPTRILRSFLKTVTLSFLLPMLYSLFGKQTFHDWLAQSKTVRTP